MSVADRLTRTDMSYLRLLAKSKPHLSTRVVPTHITRNIRNSHRQQEGTGLPSPYIGPQYYHGYWGYISTKLAYERWLKYKKAEVVDEL